jgi:hypothetical protein
MNGTSTCQKSAKNLPHRLLWPRLLMRYRRASSSASPDIPYYPTAKPEDKKHPGAYDDLPNARGRHNPRHANVAQYKKQRGQKNRHDENYKYQEGQASPSSAAPKTVGGRQCGKSCDECISRRCDAVIVECLSDALERRKSRQQEDNGKNGQTNGSCRRCQTRWHNPCGAILSCVAGFKVRGYSPNFCQMDAR